MEILYFFSGIACGAIGILWIISSNYKLVKEKSEDDVIESEDKTEEDEIIVDEGFDNESQDESNYYYVKFPHHPRPLEICVEEKLEVDHHLLYRDKIYKIINVLHKSEGHTVFVAEPKSEDNGN